MVSHPKMCNKKIILAKTFVVELHWGRCPHFSPIEAYQNESLDRHLLGLIVQAYWTLMGSTYPSSPPPPVQRSEIKASAVFKLVPPDSNCVKFHTPVEITN